MTPQLQASMRTTQTKALKRGRKKGRTGKKGSQKGGKKTTLARKAKQRILKGSKAKKSDQKKPHPPAPKTIKNAKEGKTQAKPKANAGKAKNKPAERFQERFQQSGKGWVYRVLPEQQYGCSNCRYIFSGCANCRKASFRGKSAAVMRAEQEAAAVDTEGSWDGWDWDANAWVGTDTDTKPRKSKKSRTKK